MRTFEQSRLFMVLAVIFLFCACEKDSLPEANDGLYSEKKTTTPATFKIINFTQEKIPTINADDEIKYKFSWSTIGELNISSIELQNSFDGGITWTTGKTYASSDKNNIKQYSFTQTFKGSKTDTFVTNIIENRLKITYKVNNKYTAYSKVLIFTERGRICLKRKCWP